MRARMLIMAFVMALAPASAVAAPQARFDAMIATAEAEMLTNPIATTESARRAQTMAQQLREPRARGAATAKALWLQAEAFFRLDDVSSAAPLIARAREQVRVAAPGSKLEADILLTRGSINGKLVHVADALSDFQDAHKLFRANGETRREAISLIIIANLYLDARDHGSALRYLNQALEAYRADPGLAQSIYNTRASILQELKRFDSADADFRRALGHARELKSAALEGIILRNIARNQLAANRTEAAEQTILAARRLSVGRSEEGMQLNALAAQAALQRRQLAEAGRLIDRVFLDVDLAKTDIRYRDAHLTAVGTYQAQGRPQKALAHLLALKRLDDRATKLATETSTALMAARFDSANQDAKIARLRDAERLRVARDALQRAETERTLFLIGAGATGVVIALLLISLITIRRSRDQVRAANDDLAITNGALGKALAAKTEFLATTSHEIRTPLNGILGMTQVMLADQGLPAATRDRLTVVQGAGLTMRALVDDILDVAKMETGNLELESAPFDLAGCLNDAAAIWTDQARDKGLAITLDLRRCPPRVEGDAARVRQIVFNLLSNALKFTAHGSVTVTAEATTDGIRIAVADTGIGIPPDKQAEVFEAFRQADTSTTRRFGGTGLGLSICRSLVEAMGGSIDVESALGEGSTFIVSLPLRTVAAEPVAARQASCPTLLVVDRNPITRAMFRALFSAQVDSVVFAGTLAEAAQQLDDADVCQVLVDDATARAGGDPYGFLRELAERSGAVPVTLLWPLTADIERDELLALGVTRVVAKPVSGAALVAALFPVDDRSQALVSQAA